MFQDLVEAEIIYCAIWNDKKTLAFHPELLPEVPDIFQKSVRIILTLPE